MGKNSLFIPSETFDKLSTSDKEKVLLAEQAFKEKKEEKSETVEENNIFIQKKPKKQ